jgi:7-carboxy-7-deazaguanine synthase (Cx14CxxC type)
MTYTVKEIYYTLQGEGANTGRAAVFCRFAGCNLWTGREEDRTTAICPFCDTDFLGTDGPQGGKFETAERLANAIEQTWPSGGKPLVVFTGGEPYLQLDSELLRELHKKAFEIAVETNGTIARPLDLDWICVSPKANSDVLVRSGHELKLVFPQAGAMPEQFADWDFQHFFLQPMDGPLREQNTHLATEYCLSHPQWRLSLQTHKLLGIP